MENSNWKWLKKPWSLLSHAATAFTLGQWVVTGLAAIGGSLFAYFENFGLTRSFLAFLGAAAFSMVGFYIFNIWRSERRPEEHKGNGDQPDGADEKDKPKAFDGSTFAWALQWIMHKSAWMRWQEAQRQSENGTVLSEPLKVQLAEIHIQFKLESGELVARGRISGELAYNDIPYDFWKLAFVHFVPDKKSLWRAKVLPKTGLETEAVRKIPDYADLEVSDKKVHELWLPADELLDAKTKELLAKAKE